MKKILALSLLALALPQSVFAAPAKKALTNIKIESANISTIAWPNNTQSVLAKFNISVENVSTWSLGTVALYLDGSTKPVYTKPMGIYQKVGTTKETAIGLVLPKNIEAGAHGGKVCLNYKHTVKETTYEDNCAMIDFDMEPMPAGDLIIENPSVSITNWPDNKQLIHFKSVVKNIGNLKVAHLPLVTMELNGVTYKYKIVNDPVKPNEVFYESQSAVINKLEPNIYTAKFCVGTFKDESDTTNNCAVTEATAPGIVAPPIQPESSAGSVPAQNAMQATGGDLEVSNVTYTNSLMKYTIKNVSAKMFVGSVPVQYQFKRSSQLVTNEMTTTIDLELAPGKTADISIDFRANRNSTLGKFLYAPTGYPSIFQVTLHPAPELGELNESNNTGKSVFK